MTGRPLTPNEEPPDFLALGVEAMAQSPEGRAVMRQVARGQMADLADLFGIDLEGGDQ